MGKIHLFVIFLFAVSTQAKTPEITLSESFLPEYVAQKEKVNASDVRRIVLKKDKEFKNGVILLNPSSSCGVGVCSYYTFIKNSRGSFDFAGHIDGLFTETNEIKNSNLPEIVTQTKSGTEVSEKTKWRYNQVSKVYEAQ